ncbi:hypothetical protein HOY82DRAFT_559700, partial [Tuber indicum]
NCILSLLSSAAHRCFGILTYLPLRGVRAEGCENDVEDPIKSQISGVLLVSFDLGGRPCVMTAPLMGAEEGVVGRTLP